jgi:hypothetical protein
MTHFDPDRDLRALFSRMKAEDRMRAPAFHAPPVVRHARPKWVKVAMTGAAAAAIVVATLEVVNHQLAPHEREKRASVGERDRTRSEIQRRVYAGTAWTSPTDFLLNTSTSHLLRAVPTFGLVHWIDTDSTSLDTRHRS